MSSAATATATGARVQVEDLAFGYSDDPFRLRIPEFELAPGEAVALIGPSGSGKSTLLSLLCGILLPARGSVALDGVRWTTLSEAERRARRIGSVGLVFQEFELFDPLTVTENVLLPYHVNPALELNESARDRAHELMQRLGIDALAAKRPRSLSQGERQRVALCRGLVARPGLILADEPTGNLDPESAEAALELLFHARAEGATLVVVTHDHGLLPRFDRHVDFAHWGGRDGGPLS